jgi:hypothetical protein
MASKPAKRAGRRASAAITVASAPTISVVDAVLTVIGRHKHLDPATILLADKLAEYPLLYSDAERDSLAQKINQYFEHALHMVFDTWLDGADIGGDDTTVGMVIQEVQAHHPHPAS